VFFLSKHLSNSALAFFLAFSSSSLVLSAVRLQSLTVGIPGPGTSSASRVSRKMVIKITPPQKVEILPYVQSFKFSLASSINLSGVVIASSYFLQHYSLVRL
jgi:hypothetical protein